ncbi:conjugal transfer protein, partial [Enterococcus faecalis]|uniref:conjugal transfer protein n=1 Tax=Enterococcus faecalis TaxID=1351 RepID=UPI003CC5F92B
LYPTATEKELTYYVSNHVLPMINKEYVFEELVNPIFTRKDNQVIENVAVKYLDQETKATQNSQFELILEKQDNWKIVK